MVVARDADLDRLRELIRQQADPVLPAVTIADDRWYAHYVGFRDPRLGYPDDWYDATAKAAKLMAKLTATELAWGRDATGGPALVITAQSRWAELAEHAAVRVSVDELAGVTSVAPGGPGTVVRTDFAVDQLLAVVAPNRERRVVRVEVTALGGIASAPLRTDRRLAAPRRVARHGVRLHLVTPTTNHKGQVIVAITPVTPRRFIARLRRIWPSGGK
jgi:hypothetical protein